MDTQSVSDFQARWDAMKATNLTAAERPVDGWETHPDHLYCPTYVEMGGGKIVTKTPISGGGPVVYSAWELQERGALSSHSSSTAINHVHYGRIGSRELPAALDALPAMTDERIEAVMAWHEAQHKEAKELIRSAFPGREFDDRSGSGELTTPLS